MSFMEAVNQHWDEIHILAQLCVMVAQSTMEGRFISVEEHSNNDDEIKSNNQNSGREYNMRLMTRVLDRVISLAKDIDDLSDIHACFYWMSRQDDVDLNRLQKWANDCIKICDKLATPHQQQTESSSPSKSQSLIEMNERIEILKIKHLTLRHLSYALNEEGSTPPNTERLNNSLNCILQSIELCSRTNYLIQAYNTEIEDITAEDNIEVFELIQNGELDKREQNDLVGCYHFASNLCQKMNKFEQSLDLINNAIALMKQQISDRFKNRMHIIAEPQSSSDDDDDDIMFDSDGNSIHSMMSVDGEEEDDEELKLDNEEEEVSEYVIDIEFNKEIKKFMKLKEQSWTELDNEDKLFYVIQWEIFDFLLTRGLAHSNLKNYQLAFYDSFLCTLIRPNGMHAYCICISRMITHTRQC